MKLTREDWQARRELHRNRVSPWVEAHRTRAGRGEKHPVYDFLFTYYSFRSGHLLRWSPGVEMLLEDATQADWPDFHAVDGGLILSADYFPEHRRGYLHWAIDYLEAVLDREPTFGCFGLHEWAMVYRTEEVRHSQVPLRLSPAEIDTVVDEQGLRCTHFDAFRFFTEAAVPRNRTPLTRAVAAEHDQGGCIHANMDLYKFAYAIAPYTPAELVADAFEFAREARTIDMRASPYDLQSFGFEPIAIEAKEGREEYVVEQKALAAKARSIRVRLLDAYRSVAALKVTPR